VYNDKLAWFKLIKKIAKYDFSWDKSAKKHLEIYKNILRGQAYRPDLLK